jgi:hypothetical protein
MILLILARRMHLRVAAHVALMEQASKPKLVEELFALEVDAAKVLEEPLGKDLLCPDFLEQVKLLIELAFTVMVFSVSHCLVSLDSD